jgi:hypothetical protein
VYFYNICISDCFDGMMPVSQYLHEFGYCKNYVDFFVKCLTIFAANGWEQNDIAVFKVIGFPISVQDEGSSPTELAVVLKQYNDGETWILSQMRMPEYYDKYEIKDFKQGVNYSKWRSILYALLPVKKENCECNYA